VHDERSIFFIPILPAAGIGPNHYLFNRWWQSPQDLKNT